MDNIWLQARDLIAQGQLAKSLALLRQIPGLPAEADAELIIFQARLTQLERDARLFGENEDTERNRLNKSVLDFIQNYASTAPNQAPASNPLEMVRQMRRNSLQQKIKEVMDLIAQWEQKQTLSDNPTEIKRCEIELTRLQGILNGHQKEWVEMG